MLRPAALTLRGFGRSSLPIATIQPCAATRFFHATSSHGVRAIFSKTENEALDSQLELVQNMIILPSYLPESQRRIVFDGKKTAFLRQNPIEIEVEGLEHRFTTIRETDIPDARKTLLNASSLMSTKEEWDTLATLLAGYKRAGIRLKPTTFAGLARKAGDSGHITPILECVKQAEKTGFFVSTAEILLYLFNSIAAQVAKAEGNVAEISRGVKWAELIFDILQRPAHAEHIFRQWNARNELHNSPTARAIMVYLRASLVKAKQEAGEDVAGDLLLLEDEVKLTRVLWEPVMDKDVAKDGELARLNPFSNGPSHGLKPRQAKMSKTSYVQSVAAVVAGIKSAQQFVPEEAVALKTLAGALDLHLTTTIQSSAKPEDADRYRAVLSRAPAWSKEA